MFFYDLTHDHKTLALGYLCLNDLEKLFESNPNIFVENDKINSDLIIHLCSSMKAAIMGFDSLAKIYKKYYEDEDLKNESKIDNLKKNKKKRKHQ